jgi:hypothetical protein
MENHENLGQDSHCLSRGLSRAHPGEKSEALPLDPPCVVI